MLNLPKSTIEILRLIESKTQRSSRIRVISSQTSVQSLEKIHGTDSESQIKINRFHMNNSRGSIKSHLILSSNDSISDSREQFIQRGSVLKEKLASEIIDERNKEDSVNVKPRYSNRLTQMRSRSEEIKPDSLSGSIVLSQRPVLGNELHVSENKIPSIDNSHIFFNKKECENKSKLIWVEKLQNKSSSLKGRIDQIVKEGKTLIKEGVWNNSISQLIQTCFLQFKFLLEKAHSKFILFPETERDFVENLLSINNTAVKLLKCIQNHVKILLNDQKNANLQLKNKTAEVRRLKNITEQQKNEQVVIKEEKELIKTLEALVKKEKSHSEKIENIWSVEKQQFQAEIQRLQEEIIKLQASEYTKLLEDKYDLLNQVASIELKKLNEDGEKKDTEIAKLETLLERATLHLKDMKKEMEGLKSKSIKSVCELKESQERENFYFCSQNMHREIAHMSREEVLQLTNSNKTLKGTITELKEKLENLQTRFDKHLSDHANKGGFSLEETQKDGLMINATKDILMNIKYPLFSTNLSSNKKKKEINLNWENIVLEKYTFFKPSFSLLIGQEGLLEKLKQGCDLHEIGTKLNREFIGIIRGIFDSKFNEIMNCNNIRQYSPFPDFVYSWLNCFHICPSKKYIRAINVQDKIPVEKRRSEFYKFLLNPYINKLWDVELFKHFLDEKYASDELFFYLFCRNVLFEGPQLKSLASTENVIHWLLFEKIEAAMKTILQNFDEEQYQILRKRLRGRARVKHDKVYGDTALFLKVLLEFYRNEKKKKFELLKNEFLDMYPIERNAKPHVPFNSFKQFLDVNFPFLSDVEKARVYRETWCIGNGVVDADSFFIMANENNLFMENLKFLFSNKTMFKRTEKNQLNKLELQSVFETHCQRILDSLEVCKNFASRFGIEEFLINIVFKQSELTQIMNSKKFPSEKYLYQVLIDILRLLVKTKNLHSFEYHLSKTDDNKLIATDVKVLEKLIEPLSQFEEEEKAIWVQKETNAKKIQEFFRFKKSNWYQIIKSIATETQNPTFSKNDSKVGERDLLEDKYLKNGIIDLF